MRVAVGLCLISRPIRHRPDSHIVSDRVTIIGYVHQGTQAWSGCYLCDPLFAKELSIEMYAFTVDLIDFLGGIRKIPRVKVLADMELVAYFELHFLTSEGVVDELNDIAL